MGLHITRARGSFCFLLCFCCWLAACTFDYGFGSGEEEDQPDIIMNDVEYVRVRNGDPVVRFEAEAAERYENRQAMELKNFSFEQFDTHGDEINAVGSAGAASVELDSGNIQMFGGVRLSVDSEDITLETPSLKWQDKERFLSGAETDQVDIQRSNGTSFTGQGFSADVRARTWGFVSGAEGTYIHDDDDEEAEDEDAGDEAAPDGETPDEGDTEDTEAAEGEG
jgi:LPS export ABC transporter protein LptC